MSSSLKHNGDPEVSGFFFSNLVACNYMSDGYNLNAAFGTQHPARSCLLMKVFKRVDSERSHFIAFIIKG